MSYKRRAWYKNLREIQHNPIRQSVVDCVEEYKAVDRRELSLIKSIFMYLGELCCDFRNRKAREAIRNLRHYTEDLEMELAYLRSAVDSQDHNNQQHELMRSRYSEMRRQAYLGSPYSTFGSERPN